jgi:hypothetical protein
MQNQPHMAIQLNNFSLWEVLPCCEKFQFFCSKFNDTLKFFRQEFKKLKKFSKITIFLCIVQVGNQKCIRIYFFHSYFVNSQIWLNQLMDDLIWLHHQIERKRLIQLLWFSSLSLWFFLSIWTELIFLRKSIKLAWHHERRGSMEQPEKASWFNLHTKRFEQVKPHDDTPSLYLSL